MGSVLFPFGYWKWKESGKHCVGFFELLLFANNNPKLNVS